MIISLENFDQYGRSKPILNSPRSLQACKRQGVEPEELLKKTAEQIKHIYRDSFNDRKSLEIKAQHYELRRAGKLQLVRKERIDILTNVKPVYRPNHASTKTRVEVIEVEDKLEKKKMMDEVKAEIMRKQMALKQAKVAQKLSQIQHKKKQSKLKHECSTIEHQKRKQINKLEVELNKETKINNYLLTGAEKEAKIERAQIDKRNQIENIRKEKEAYFQQKVIYAKQLEDHKINQKRQKVSGKFNQIDKRQEDRAMQDLMYRKNLQDERRKDEMWKESKRKQVELETRKRQSEIWQNLKYKDIKKEEYLYEIEGKKSRHYNNKKQDRAAKEELIKAKLMEDEQHIEKKRRIMELIQEDQKKQLEQKKANERLQMQSRKEDLVQREKDREEKLKEEQEDKRRQGQFIIENERQKLEDIEKKKQLLKEQEKQKNLIKELKAKETQQNRLRQEKIKNFEKQEKVIKYQDKVAHIEQQKREQKSVKLIRKVSREEIQSRILEEHEIDNRSKRYNSRDKSTDKIENIKQEARKNPIEKKEKLKNEQVSKLIQNLKIKCNKEEYLMMKGEESVEKQRQELEKTAQNVAELRRIQKIHGVERARFQQRLTILMKANQDKVQKYRIELLR